MVIINQPKIESYQGKSRLVSDIAVDNETRKIWFEVSVEYGQYLCYERSDAFLIGLLPWAMRNDQDITCIAPVTEEMLYNIRSYLIPSLVKHGKTLYASKINASIDSSPLTEKPAQGVGTGFSCGIDSFHAVLNNYRSEYPHLKLTHLVINNVGAFNDTYAVAGIEEVRQACYERSAKAAEELGLPMIATDSNFGEVLSKTIFLPILIPLCLRSLQCRSCGIHITTPLPAMISPNLI